MKKALLTILIITPLFLFSQAFQNNAPWMKDSSLKNKGKITLKDISIAAEKYFSTVDRFKKGSGLKPFERWKYNARFYLNSDGTFAPPQKLWDAWRQKNRMAKTAVDNSNWQSLGPNSSSNTYSSSTLKSSGQGRINAIAVDPNNSNTYYVGAPAGGIWKSTDAGVNWQPLTDYLPQIGVSGIAISPTDSNIIYIATGDDDANDSPSIGVMKSIDGGTTWNTTGTMTGNPNSMNEIYIDPNNTNTILIATSSGVFKTIDGGTNWVQKFAGNIIDLKMKPGDATTWYAVSDTKFYRSTDSGETFTEVAIPALTAGSTRLTIDVTIADPNYVYMASAGTPKSKFNGVYKSTDSGATFTKTAETNDIFNSDQAWYDFAITVSSSNKDIVYVGVLDIWKSTNGGDSFTKLTEWFSPDQPSYTHADIHFLRFIDGKFFAGTDGGIYRSTNEGVNFTDLTNTLGISQFYKISVSPLNSNIIVGGIQDNGGMAFNTDKWRNWHGGDGMEGNAHPTEPNTHYGFSQFGGGLDKTIDGGRSKTFIASAPTAETDAPNGDSGGEWVTPMVINSAGVVYAGYKKLYKIVNNAWVLVSNATLNIIDDIDHLELDPKNDNNIFLAESSDLFLSKDGGVNFTKIYSDNVNFLTINGIEISNTDSNVGWIITDSKVLKSVNILSATPTFTDITGNLPSDTKLTIKHHERSGNNTIYLGTTLGVYFTNDNLANWNVFENNLPNVQVRDLDINEEDSKLYAGTYGRGVFVTDIPRTLPANDVRLLSIQNPNSTEMDCSNGVSPKVVVKNQGTSVINSATINYSFDGQPNSTLNWTGTLNSNASTTIDIPTSNLSLGNHTLRVEVTITNDTYSQNNVRTTSFTLNSSNTSPTIMNTFETGADDLLTESNTNTALWQRGAPTKTNLTAVGSGTSAYITTLSGNYPINTTGYLYTNCYDLTLVTNPVLSFKMAFDIELDYDYMNVEYTTDKGKNWSILGASTDANWYNSNSTANGLPGKQWTGYNVNSTLQNYSFDLAAFTNASNIIFRFKFKSDDQVTSDGIVLDDLVITGILPVEEFNDIEGLVISPNPSSSIFNINWAKGSDFSIAVFDITGKLILQKESSSVAVKQFELDLSKYSKGIYFAKIKVDESFSTKKLILK